MELLIRSQDKKHLLKCEALLIEGVGNNRFGIRVFTKNYDFNIANYETKERALEVLDEIQNILKRPIIIQKKEGRITVYDNNMHIIRPTYETIKQLETYIYEMPEN